MQILTKTKLNSIPNKTTHSQSSQILPPFLSSFARQASFHGQAYKKHRALPAQNVHLPHALTD
jgi:hypothetical protein